VSNNPHFLLTNDDGVQAEGLRRLEEVLRRYGRVTIIAPDRERSGVSHAFSLNHPLLLEQHGPEIFSLSGTPADCVMFGVRGCQADGEVPDYVFAGINHGANLGEDVIYSGTVAAAREAAIYGIPSVAVSLATEFSTRFDSEHLHLETAAHFVEVFLPHFLEQSFPPNHLLSINVPNIPVDQLKGGRFATLGKRVYRDHFIKKKDEKGRESYWLTGENPTHEPSKETDFHALEESYASITPLRHLYSDPEDLKPFSDWPSLERDGNAP